jgi:hypothetical protein
MSVPFPPKQTQKYSFTASCIFSSYTDKMYLSASQDVVDNRGEDLRFPISSSSGFSSPMKRALRKERPIFYLKAYFYKGSTLLRIYYLFNCRPFVVQT